MRITGIDHLVLTVRDIPTTVHFYETVLNMRSERFGTNRIALNFGGQKINLHQLHQEFEPKAEHATPGSADLCLITDTPLAWAIEQVKKQGVEILEGPVKRSGARGEIMSFYFRDPDLNLIEVANYT